MTGHTREPGAADLWRALPFSEEPMGRQLALSEGMLAALGDTGAPALRWYIPRERALVLGNGQPVAVADSEALAAHETALYKRPSGGTAVLVDAALLSLDLALPHAHPLATSDVVRAYEWIGALWAETLQALGAADVRALPTEEVRALEQPPREDPLRLACYGTLSPWEVVTGEPPRKLVGLCQIRRRHGALYQIGVYLHLDAAGLARLLAVGEANRTGLAGALAHAAAGLDEAMTSPPDAAGVISAFEQTLTRRHRATLLPSAWLPSELAYADQIERERFQRLA